MTYLLRKGRYIVRLAQNAEDVADAQAFGCDLLYIANGIHAGEYSGDTGIDPERLDSFLLQNGANPTYWMPKLQNHG